MKKIAIIPASLLLCTVAMSSCNSNKLAVATTDDNMYFMSADVKKASQNAVANNQPSTFQPLADANAVPQDNFSARNVNPEYLSRYGQVNGVADQDVVYFDDNQQVATGTTPNIDIYNNFSINNGNAWRNPAFNMGFSPFGMGMGFSPFGMGMGFSPFGMGMGMRFSPFGMGMMGFSPFGMGMYDPFFNPGWGWRPGFNVGLNFGWGNPMFNNFGGGLYDPFWGGGHFGSPWGWGMGRPILATGPIIVLPGSEYGNRRVVYGARPSRGSSFTNGAGGLMQNSSVPSTARAQARENVANAGGASPRRMGANESSRAASRDFSTSQNDYYSTGRSRVESTSRNVNSAASGRGTVSNTRNSSSSARPSASPANSGRSYGATPSRSSYSTTPSRSTNSSPSYNRSSTGTINGSRSTNSSGRNQSSSYNSGNSQSRSSSNSSSFSAPSRVSSGGSYSAPSRSSSGSSGGSSSGGSRGRGN